MHIQRPLGQSLPGRRRLAVATLVVAFCITLALAIGGTASASAAGPDDLRPGQSATYPTWVFGTTKVCATNNSWQPGVVDVRPRWSIPPGQHDPIYVPPFSTRCIERWWGGNLIDVTNISHTELGTYPVLTVQTS